jgi:serine/threonine protein kinase
MTQEAMDAFGLDIARRVDALCDAFEHARRRGDKTGLERWLAQAGDLASHALAELARIDLECRLAAGEAARVEDYLARFHVLQQDVPALFGLAEAEYRHRKPREPGLSAEDYRSRFPALAGHPMWESGPSTVQGVQPQSAQATHSAPSLPVPGDSESTVESLDFLDPAEAAGELGRLDGYPVLGILGKGGMGMVLLAQDPRLRRQVAIKVMLPQTACLPDAKERFLREARATAEVEHERVITIHHVGEVRGQPYLVMPLLRGESLRNRLDREPVLPVAEVLRLGRQIAEGLAAAHARGLIHRDVKPANIWLEAASDGVSGPPRVKLLDFGLVRPLPVTESSHQSELTQTGMVLGTQAYMSPQQAVGQSIDGRSDLFSLGVVLYEMCAGQRPPAGVKRLQASAAAPLDVRTVNPAVDAGLAALLQRLLAVSAEDRPASAAVVVEELRRLEAGASDPQDKITAAWPIGRPLRPVRWRVAAFAVVVLSTLAGLSVWLAVRARTSSEQTAPSGRIAIGAHGKVSFKGDITALLTSKAEGKYNLPLSNSEALPARVGYQWRLESWVEPAAYLYVLAIDENGTSAPWYPWQPGKWGTRPNVESPVRSLSLPTDPKNGWEILGPNAGMNALVMLARETPLDLTDDALKAMLAGVRAQRPSPSQHAAIWLENGQEVRDEPDRKRTFGTEEKALDSPIARMQAMIRDKLQPHADYTRAVMFAKAGN